MKLLHSADWHLDAPLSAHSPEDARFLKEALLSIPSRIAELAIREKCDLALLSGDLFDGPYTKASLDAVHNALQEMRLPVFISPGNHDFCSPTSPWLRESFPENVHIFTGSSITSVTVPGLDCRVYGAGFQSMDSPALLEHFHADCSERYAIGVFHGDPTQSNSPYNPITSHQVRESGLDYLALGHIHKGGSFRTGSALCAWPGSPMGRGFDEQGEKGALIVTLEEGAQAKFISLGLPQFFDISAEVRGDPADTLQSLLPPAHSNDFYRITFTGEAEGLNTSALASAFPQYPHLQLRDRTQPPVDLWKNAGEDSLEGIYFGTLQQLGEAEDPDVRRRAALAARISRMILNGQEVPLP